MVYMLTHLSCYGGKDMKKLTRRLLALALALCLLATAISSVCATTKVYNGYRNGVYYQAIAQLNTGYVKGETGSTYNVLLCTEMVYRYRDSSGTTHSVFIEGSNSRYGSAVENARSNVTYTYVHTLHYIDNALVYEMTNTNNS